METRETYLGLKSDFYTHVHDLPPQLGGAPPLQRPLLFAMAAEMLPTWA